MICRFCRTALPAGAMFCGECGRPTGSFPPLPDPDDAGGHDTWVFNQEADLALIPEAVVVEADVDAVGAHEAPASSEEPAPDEVVRRAEEDAP